MTPDRSALRLPRVRLHPWIPAAVWTACVAASLIWNLQQQQHHSVSVARAQAQVSFDNDLMYRRWAAKQGGVYVRVSEDTAPNPYLHVPDRDVTTTGGVSLTLMNPAYVARQVNEMAVASGGSLGHLTSLKPIRPENAPDPWEAAALRSFEQGATEVSGLQRDGRRGEVMRFIRPFLVEKSCLSCHGAQGYQEGDIRGGISVSVPMGPIRAVEQSAVAGLIQAHAGFWLLGLFGLFVFTRSLGKQAAARERVQEALRAAEQTARERLAEIEGLYHNAPVGLCVLDRDLRFVRINERLAEINGVHAAEHIGRTVREILPELASEVEPPMRRMLETGEPRQNVEIAGETPAQPGVRRSWLEQWFPVKDEVGRITGLSIVVEETTERRKAEEALRESEARLNRAQEIAHLGSWELDLTENRLAWSDEVFRIFGLQPQEFDATYEAFLEQVHPDDRAAVDAAYSGSVRDGRDSYEIEHRIVRRGTGEIRTVHEKCQHQRDEQGRIVRSIGMVHDVTEWRLAEEALRRSEARWNAAIETIAEGTIIATEDEQVIYWNPSARRMHGFTRPDEGLEPLEKTPVTFQLWTPDGRRMLDLDEWPMRRIKRGEAVRGLELRIRRPDQGWEKVFSYSGAMVETSGGERIIFLSCYDLTDLRRAEQALRESDQRFRLALRNAPVSVAVQDRDLRYIWAYNQRSARPDQIVGRTDRELFTPAEAERLIAIKRRVLEEGVELREQMWLDHPTGRMYLDICWEPVRDEAGDIAGVASATVDLTPIKQAEESLEIRVRERTADLQTAVGRLEAEIRTREAAERELRESEERYRSLFEAAPVGISIANFDGRVLAMNDSMRSILGLERDAAGPVNISSHYDSAEARRSLLAEVRRNGHARGRETVMRRADGSRFDALLQMERLEIRRLPHVLAIVEDVTKQKLEQRHLAGIRRLLELFPRASTRQEYLDEVVRLLARWCDCNGAGVRLLGENRTLPYAAKVGFSPAFVAAEEALWLAAEECPCVRILRGHERQEDGPFITEHGSFFCAQASAYSGCTENGDAAACLTARYESIAHAPIRYRDQLLGSIHLMDRRAGRFPPETVSFVESASRLIGEALHRFGVEEALGDSEQRFRSLFERNAAAMLLIEPESGALVDANRAAADFYGFPLERLRTMGLWDLAPAPREGGSTWEPAGTGPVVAPHRLSDGTTRVVEVHSSPIEVEGRRLLFAIIHDITERRQLEQLVLDVGEKERQRVGQDLHDSLGGKLAGAALLAKALAQRLAMQGVPENDLAEDVVRCINDSISQTRAISRGLCPLELASSGLDAALADFAGEIRHRSELACHFTCDPEVEVHDQFAAAHLFRIVQEAVNNALRHGRPRNTWIRLGRKEDDLLLEVEDDGVGLPAGLDMTRGLGLRTMTYRAGALGGRLAVRRRADGPGTVVSCMVPWSSIQRVESRI